MKTRGEAVLVVDDDFDLLEMVRTVLEVAGHRVVTAAEGEEALAKVAEGLPGMILLDMKMPGMDGWEFARQFRARYDHKIPVVVLTAAENAADRAREIGADDYLGKPFDINDLLRIVERYLHGRPE